MLQIFLIFFLTFIFACGSSDTFTSKFGERADEPTPDSLESDHDEINLTEDLLAGSSETPPATEAITGRRKLLAILVNYRNTPLPVRNYRTPLEQVAAYYFENSYRKMSFELKTVGPYTIAQDASCSVNYSLALRAANPEIDFRQYQNAYVAVVAPLGSNCGYAGYATGRTRVTLDGITFYLHLTAVNAIQATRKIIAHEIGHLLGVGHTDFLRCGTQTFPMNSRCTYSDGHDYSSTMSHGQSWFRPFHFNAIQKEQMGWLDSSNVRTVRSSGEFDIQPMSSYPPGLKALRIPRRDGDIYIEYRQPVEGTLDVGMESLPFSSGAVSTDYYEGALIHLPDSRHTMLLDASPSGTPSGSTNVSLRVGRTVRDPRTGVRFTTVSKSPTALRMRVTFP